MKVTVLGCGGSLGVPMIGNKWGACDPNNPKNRRRRPSILVETETTTVLVDTGPDVRMQLIDAGVTKLDAILYTHEHADHMHGLDDVRPLAYRAGGPLPTYGNAETIAHLRHAFAFAVASVEMDRGLYSPYLDPRIVDEPFSVGDLAVLPFVQDHGFSQSLGFRFGPFAYSTDVVRLDDEAFRALDGVAVWIVDAVREEPHPSHAHLALALEWIDRVRPEQAYLSHLNHTMDYERLRAKLPRHVAPAYDGLVIEV